jgi:hypothetical protein
LVIQWPHRCISYDLQYEASKQVSLADAEAAARAAFDGWQTAICPGSGLPPGIHLLDQFGPVACKVHEYNQTDGNANIIMFHDDKWVYDEATNAIAMTTVTFNYKTGDIYDVDIEINGTKGLSTSQTPTPDTFDLQSILAHETGHFLGLAHSLEPGATMRSTYDQGDISFRDLADDDIAGICAVYPPEDMAKPGTCDFTPRGGFTPECGIFPTHGGMCSVGSLRAGGAEGGIGGWGSAWGWGLAVTALGGSLRARARVRARVRVRATSTRTSTRLRG